MFRNCYLFGIAQPTETPRSRGPQDGHGVIVQEDKLCQNEPRQGITGRPVCSCCWILLPEELCPSGDVFSPRSVLLGVSDDPPVSWLENREVNLSTPVLVSWGAPMPLKVTDRLGTVRSVGYASPGEVTGSYPVLQSSIWRHVDWDVQLNNIFQFTNVSQMILILS